MDRSDKTQNLEFILKTCSEKKPFSLYCAEEKHTKNLSSNVLKPQDIISAVTKQLGDIQKADSLKKERVSHTVKPRQTGFVPINIYIQEHHHVNKFETQYVTDTQLIDIVDNVEAMVSINIDMSQDIQTTSAQMEGKYEERKKKTKDNKIADLRSAVDEIIIENVYKDSEHHEQYCIKEDELCIDEINTEVCNEFDTSYSGVRNDNSTLKNRNIMTTQHCKEEMYINKIAHNYTSQQNTKKEIIQPYMDKHNEFLNNITGEYNKAFCNNDITNKEFCLYLENDLNTDRNIFDTDSNKPEDNIIFHEKEIPSSPILKNSKHLVRSKTLTPLIFPLESFEKFESLAMPIIDGKVDFEAAKYLINSQIKDNALLISANTDPVLKKTTDYSIFENTGCNVLNEKLLDSVNKDHVDRSIESEQTVNKSTSFEDEILFSSDDENDCFHYSSKDLPLTCVLKTSCVESENKFDDTVLMGFQTSSNKCIQVSKDSFIKAKNVFDSVGKEKNINLTFTEIVDTYENNAALFNNNNLPFNQTSEKSSKTNTDNVNNYCDDILQRITTKENKNVINNHVLEEPTLNEFKTAYGNSIVISEKALQKCKTIFKEIAEDVSSNNMYNVSLKNAVEKKQEFVGFKTASNKIIKISGESLAISNKIFEDVNLYSEDVPLELIKIENIDRQSKEETLNQSTQKPVDYFVKNKPDPNDYYINIVDQTLLHEFENESIEEASHKDVDCSELQALVDFQTTEKQMKKSQASLEYDGGLCNDTHRVCNSELNEKFDPGISDNYKIFHLQGTSKSCGFKTANNKEIKVSAGAMAKTKDLFHDIVFEDLPKYERNSDNNFECNIEKRESSNGENVMKSANINKYDGRKWAFKTKVDLRKSEEPSICHGFKTASNKQVKISKQALLKTKKIFQDIDSMSIYKEDLPTKNEVNSNVSKRDASFSIQGIKTASNKCVNVTEGAVAKTKRIFQDMLSDMKMNVKHDGPICDVKSGEIIENIDDIRNDKNVSLKTAECIYLNKAPERSDINKSVDNTVTSKILGFQGFKTASEKQVKISEDALAKTKYIFKDLDCENSIVHNENRREIIYSRKQSDENISKNTSGFMSEESRNTITGFKGFQTASNKCVTISDEAIARSRRILDEIDLDIQTKKDMCTRSNCFNNEDLNKENVEYQSEDNVLPVFGFRKATNECFAINEDSLKKSKQLYSHLDNNLEKMNQHAGELKTKKITEIDIINNAIDTQLLNNYEHTLHTQDFHTDTTPKTCKRSGSPILSCPKAKKRKKFETPYRSNTNVVNVQDIFFKVNEKSELKHKFSENYKKTKLYSLKDLEERKENKNGVLIDPYILNFDFDTLLKFEFEGSRNDFTDVRWTTDNIKTCFVESVDNKIIPEGWLDNHLKLILWKLISYEIRFPNALRGVCSVRNVLDQLKYRYDKELYCVERPALRKLLEKDDISTRTMILAVAGVFGDGVRVHSVTNPTSTVELLVTDGWYCVKACADRMLSRLVSDGKIAVGRKIATVGAELLNCEQGVSPWEDTSAVRLKLFGNSTRPARWDARLGFHRNGTILSQLSTIDPSGGKVCKTRAFVCRVYPALYVEKLEDGSTVTRSERLEHLHQVRYEMERQNQLEKLYEEVEKEFLDQESSESDGVDTDLKKSHETGSQLNRLMKKSNDLTQFRSRLTDSQAVLLQEYSSRRKEKIVEKMQSRVQDKIRSQGLQLGRNVIPLLKIRVAAFDGENDVKVSKAMISIWRPSDAILEVVKEGIWIDFFNIVPTATRNSEIQMSASRQSAFNKSKYKEKDKMKPYIESLQRKCFTAKDLNKYPAMHTDFNEIDTVGMVFLIEPSMDDFEAVKGQLFQNVYLSDLDKNLICINFWGGIKKFGYENIFETGNVVACINLQKRAGNTRKSIPQYRATELTVFTKTPKLDHVRKITEELIKKSSGLDKRKFCKDCVAIKNNYTTIRHGSEISPYRFNTSDYNLSKNKMFIDSPLAHNKDLNLNLTGLDFESTFKQAETQELSPAVLKRKQVVKDKIAKLKMYGEPPPLSKIHFVSKFNNAGSAYKSPLTSNVAIVKNLNSPITTDKVIQSSPILPLNRTFVVRSGVHPVKLNFSATSVDDDKIEANPFLEEFEASPPLSLDGHDI